MNTKDYSHKVSTENEFKNSVSSGIILKINEYFKMPISYIKDKHELKKNISTDLELINTIDGSCNPIYSYCFNIDNDVSKKITEQIINYYTTDIDFLKDNQKLIKEYLSTETRYTKISPNYKNIIDIWNELKIESGFREKYYYIDWDTIEFLNKSEFFLQFISLYNLFSPIFSLMVPIIILIIPFFILKMKGMSINIYEYINVLKEVAKSNAIGKLFTINFSEINANERIYILVSAAFYLFSIYQNIMVCIKFNNNMKTIHNHFNVIILYLDNTINSMENYLNYSKDLTTHNEFNNVLSTKILTLKNINKKLKSITEYNLYNIGKFKEIGKVLKYFYELHSEIDYDEAIMYSIGFNGYIDCIEGLQQNILERKINFASFINTTKKGIFKNSYHACLKDNNPIKNTVRFKKNIIISGPNASGKTTIIKSTLINIIFTQQFGCGFFDYAKFKPFKHLHCYLNIPDTSGRDSLFQAEARRCKEIIDIISDNKNDSHFCLFDELYSGTNPEEAEKSATSFMNYLNKIKNVSTMLTTHFIKICDKLNDQKEIQNYKMVTEQINKKLVYKYKLEKGISKVKGVINVLTDLNYPKEIIDDIYEISNNK
jgi:hypothetical protein